MSEQVVYLAEFYPEARTGYAPPPTKLIGVFSSQSIAERELLDVWDKKVTFPWKDKLPRWADKPKGRFLISGDGLATFGRIREIELNRVVDGVLSLW